VGETVTSKVVGTRVDSDIAERLEEIARKKRKRVSELLKEIIDSYLESAGEEDTDTGDSAVDYILNQFNNKALEYVESVKNFCRGHSESVAQNHNIDKEFVYEHCLWSLRRHVYNTLKLYYEERVKPLLRPYIRDTDTQVRVERRAIEIINNAVKELYPYPYPPVKSP
jgi:predicted DNA-binding protein